MKTLNEILADQLETAYPLDTLDSDFDTFDFEMVPVKYAVEDGE